MRPLIVLAGPTASGKSETAIELANHINTEIISADSMQVYKFFDIGTAKPSQEIRKHRPHHLIDIREPHEQFNAYEFKNIALKKANQIAVKGKVPIIVGGTGLYLKIFLENFKCASWVGPEIRGRVQTEIALKGSKIVYEKLAQIDPIYAQKISPTDPLRVERAYSVYLETGIPFSRFHELEKTESQKFEPYVFIFHLKRKELYQNIENRIDSMVKYGWIEEVAGILNRGIDRKVKPTS